jgi:regulator of ribonuclease activity A
VCAPGLRDFGGVRRFSGPIATVHAPADNSLVRRALEQPGLGRVLVVDGEGGMTCALLGEQLAALGVKNGWGGVVMHGCVRDTEALATMALGVKALGVHPRKSQKQGRGAREVPLTFLGVTFLPGSWLYADADGILVAPARLDP